MHPRSLPQLPEPDAAASAVSARLADLIRNEMALAGGALGFDRYMELALYAPGLGYYSAGAQKFGAAGDFVTAPEISPLYGRCLARQAAEVLERLGGGEVLELGAGSGALAVDLLRELEALGQAPTRYRILEVSADLRQRQQARLAAELPQWRDRVEWLERLPERPLRGVIIGNEVMDALPVERFRVTAEGLCEERVAWGERGLEWRLAAAGPALRAAVAALERSLGGPLAEGYGSELCLRLGPWLEAVAATLEGGAVLLVDYGYPRAEYYLPERGNGTLTCYYRHRAHDDPLRWPGLQDITAHVDFTAVAEAAVAAGLQVAGYTSQAWFLFGCGLESLLAESDPADTARHLRQAQQVKRLTLPGEMGERFKAIALTRGIGGALRGFALNDQRQRL